MDEQQEKELIEGIRTNDNAAAKRFVAYYGDRIIQLVRRKLGKDHEDCKDLASEILWEAIVKIRDGGFEAKKGRFAPYLFGIVNNCCRNYFKAQKKNSQVVLSDMAAPATEAKWNFLESDMSLAAYHRQLQERRDEEVSRALERAITGLEEKYKKLIYLKYYQRLSYEAISEKERLPIAKVKSRLFEARRKLEQIVMKKIRHLSNF